MDIFCSMKIEELIKNLDILLLNLRLFIRKFNTTYIIPINK